MVLPGFSPTRAKFFLFKIRLITEDFPTLDLPAKAISGKRELGKSLGAAADIKNSTLTFKEIADKYHLDLSMIYYLNRGDYHSLPEETYPLREVKDFSKKYWYCIDCGIQITKGAKRCTVCDHKNQQVVKRPSRIELKRLIYIMPFTTIGAQFGVSDNTIKKWCQAYDLPYRKKDIKNFNQEEWDKI